MHYKDNFSQSIDSNLTQLSHFAIGPCMDVIVEGNLAYTGNGGFFQIIDITNPTKPEVIGEVLLPIGEVFDIEISGNFAYILAPFTVIDITDPYNPEIIFSEIIGVGTDEILIQGNYAYLGGFSSISIVDIKDPYNPDVLGFAGTSGEMVNSIAIYDNYLYATTYDGLVIDIFDITNKNNPVWVNGKFIGHVGGGLFVKDTLLYAGCLSQPQFRIYNISDPLNPTLLNGLIFEDVPIEISVKDTIAFASLYTKGFSIINITNNNPIEIEHINTNYSPYIFNHSVSENNLLISFFSGFDIINIENIDSTFYLGTFFTSDFIGRIDIRNNLMYCATYYGGLKIIDYLNPEKLEVIGQYQNKSPFKDLEVGDSITYVLTDHSVILINTQNPNIPFFISELEFNNSFRDEGAILLIDTILIASIDKNYFGIINVKNPYLPSLVDSFPAKGYIVDLGYKDGILFSSEKHMGTQVYDLKTKPPINIGSLSEGLSFSLLIKSNLLFCFMDGLFIYNIENPSTPLLIKSYFPFGSGIVSADMSILNDYLFLGLSRNLEAINISNPLNPYLEGYIREDDVSAVASSGNLVFKGNRNNGIIVYKADFITSAQKEILSSLSELTLFQNYPNPFNSMTNISYYLPQSGNVNIKIFDVLGNEIESLVNEFQYGGKKQIQFNSMNYASGVYFVQLKTIMGVINKKIILMK